MMQCPEVQRRSDGRGEQSLALGIVGTAYVAFAVLSALGLRDPLRSARVLLLQLCYKSVWISDGMHDAQVLLVGHLGAAYPVPL
jgi:hypothetical protein